MANKPPGCWPNAASYSYLRQAGRADLAWEWLRREPAYRRLALSWVGPLSWQGTDFWPASEVWTSRWGCLNLVNPALAAGQAPIMWSASVDPSVLRVIALPVAAHCGDTFDLRKYRTHITIVRSRSHEHVLLRKRHQIVRFDVQSGTLLDGPVSLNFDLMNAPDFRSALVALQSLRAFCGKDHFPVPRFSSTIGAKRQVIALRVHDAIAHGASIREIGEMLYGKKRIKSEWPGQGDSLKSQCRRLIALSRRMLDGGYKSLLSSCSTRPNHLFR